MNPNPKKISNDGSQETPPPESYFETEEWEEQEDDFGPYQAGEADRAYRENPTYQNAIDAAKEIWGIPDPRANRRLEYYVTIALLLSIWRRCQWRSLFTVYPF